MPGNLRETSKRKQSFRTLRGICFIGKEHSADPALHSSRRKKYGLNTKTERQPWKNPRAVFCISVAFFPYIVGIDADISKAICDKLGYELKIEDMSFETILASVNSGKADFGAAGMTVTPEREESVDFTDTYADATQVVIVRK